MQDKIQEIRNQVMYLLNSKLNTEKIDSDDYALIWKLIDGYADQLDEAQRREQALLADLKEACATTCGFCKHAEYHPMRGSYPGKPCPGNQNDCNGECQNFEWRGPQAGRGEAE